MKAMKHVVTILAAAAVVGLGSLAVAQSGSTTGTGTTAGSADTAGDGGSAGMMSSDVGGPAYAHPPRRDRN